MPRTRTMTATATLLAVLAHGTAAMAASVDYGPISHKGDKTVGAASTSLKLSLELGLIASQSGLQSAVKAPRTRRLVSAQLTNAAVASEVMV